MRLLLVEDDPMIGRSLAQGLRQDGYAVDWVRDGQAARHSLSDAAYAVVLLDLGLPRVDGRELLAQLRHRHNDVPVLIITARDSVTDRVEGLDAGADDYLVKPFSLDEVAARVRALLRRRTGVTEPWLTQGPLTLNPSTHEVQLEGEPVHLSAREFALLEALLRRPGIPLSRSQLETSIYGWGEEVGSNAIEVHIHALRRKLGAESIENVRGVGYRIPKQQR
ncbi:MAG TPA: response regulator [Steroidobacteraceae bacterium]|jgi:two-component system response regulator QseB|nr:response regulator [Steroidobacteraceae bacterium]